jgi:hypothetical protein
VGSNPTLSAISKLALFEVELPQSIMRKPETPFDTIENAQEYLQLLLEAISEARNDVAADLKAAEEHSKLDRRIDALRLVEFKMEKLEQHLRNSSRDLNDLRTLRRLLLEERVYQPAEEKTA